MTYQKLRHFTQSVGLVTLVLLAGNAMPVDAWQAWTREERRSVKPVEKMQTSLESSKRDIKMQPERVLDVFGVKRGEVVADVGAGTGYFSFRLASRVGAEGKVYATEIEDQLLDFMLRKIEKNSVKNIILLKSAESEANLPPQSCDKILIVGTYYYFPDAVSYMTKLRKALKPGGLVGIIDLDKSKVGKLRKDRAKLTIPSVVVEEMNRAGFVLRQEHNFLEDRYFLVFSAIE